MKRVSQSLTDTALIAAEYLKELAVGESATVVALEGDLGSGKTSFVQALARALGVKGEVTSPTFVVEKVYKLEGRAFSHLVHIDAYRIESSAELVHLGWNELIADRGNLIVVEWPERIADILPANKKTVSFQFVDETTRHIQIASHG